MHPNEGTHNDIDNGRAVNTTDGPTKARPSGDIGGSNLYTATEFNNFNSIDK